MKGNCLAFGPGRIEDGRYYRCHDRCGVRGIKKETLESAVLDCFHAELFSAESLAELQAEIRQLLKRPQQNHLIAQLKKEIRAIEIQIEELASMLREVKHRRPLIQRIDALEDERQELDTRVNDMKQVEKPEILSMTPADLEEFPEKWRTDPEGGTMNKRKAVFRQLIDSAVFDGEELELGPNTATLTGAGCPS